MIPARFSAGRAVEITRKYRQYISSRSACRPQHPTGEGRRRGKDEEPDQRQSIAQGHENLVNFGEEALPPECDGWRPLPSFEAPPPRDLGQIAGHKGASGFEEGRRDRCFPVTQMPKVGSAKLGISHLCKPARARRAIWREWAPRGSEKNLADRSRNALASLRRRICWRCARVPTQSSEVVAILNQVGDLLEIEGANPFRVRAYRKPPALGMAGPVRRRARPT